MDLEDDIEDAEEKGWSETLIFHEIFNILRKKEINNDIDQGYIAQQQQRLNLMCEMRGDLFVWCPADQLIYTTNLKCLHSNTKHYRKIYQKLTCTNSPLFDVHRLLASPSDKHVALIGNEGVSVLEVQRHRGQYGEFGGGQMMVNCKCSFIDPDYFTAKRHTGVNIVMHVEWINDDELILLTSDETIRAYNILKLNGPVFVIMLAKNQPLLALHDCFISFTLLPAPLHEEDDISLILLKSNGDTHILSIRRNKEFLPVWHRLGSALPMLPTSEDNYEMSAHSILVLTCSPPVIIISTTSGTCYHCILLPLEDHEDGAGAQLLVYDGLQHEEGVEQLNQGAELLADPSYNYQYYIIDRTGIQRVTLLWVMNVDYFLQDMSTDLQSMFADGTSNSEVQHLVVTHPLVPDSPMAGQLVCGICCVASRMLGHVLIAMTTERECITLSIREPRLRPELQNGDVLTLTHTCPQTSFLEEQVKAELFRSRGVPIISNRGGAKLNLQECYEMLCDSTRKLRNQQLAQQEQVKQLLKKRMESLLRQRRKQEEDLIMFNQHSRAITRDMSKIKDRVSRLQQKNKSLCSRLRAVLCSLETSTPDLSEMESNAQKELKEMTLKVKQLQNDLKVCSARLEQDNGNSSLLPSSSLSSQQLSTVHQLLRDESSRLSSLVKSVKELNKYL